MKKEILFLEETNKLGGAQYNYSLQKFKPRISKALFLSRIHGVNWIRALPRS